MSERYSKLFALPENLYATGSPVVIAAGALLKDNQTGKVLAQLKLRNIDRKSIKAATVCVEPLDTVGNLLGEPVTYQYLDLQADRDVDFGQKAPIPLPNSATRSFVVSVVQVIFAENAIWNADSAEWKPLSRPQALDALEDSELTKQFRIECGGGCENLLLEQKDLWHCVCGGVNRQEEDNCHKCGKSLTELQAIDMEDLQAKKEERVAREQEEAEAARFKAQQEAEIAKVKAKKIGTIISLILVIAIVATSIISRIVKEHNAYKDALALMDAGQYEKAIAAFEAMDGYKDSFAQIEACHDAITDRDYNTAVELIYAGQYEEAIAILETIENAKDSTVLNGKYYSAVEEVLLNGDIAHAAMLFGAADYNDSKARSFELWDTIAVRETISAGLEHTVGLKSDGTVVAVGDNKDGQCDVSGWTDIVAIAAGDHHTVGLKSDGTVVAVGENYYGQCNISGWTDIVAIAAGDDHTVGLKSDGTVVAKGEVYSAAHDVFDWTDIVAIAAGNNNTVGLKSDGTVVATGAEYKGQCNVSGWTDIVAIAAGDDHTVGLKSDGTVVAVGENYYGQCDTSGWTDIMAVATGCRHTVGLKSDGTVVAVGENQYEQCKVSDWIDIVAVSAGYAHTVGLKSDGTVVVTGYNRKEQCNVSGWTDIMLP